MKKEELKQLLQHRPDLRSSLFVRGFLITTREDLDLDPFPFYGNWTCQQFQRFKICGHRAAGIHLHKPTPDKCFFILGHAYDPFAMEEDEAAIRPRLAAAYGSSEFMAAVNNLTGVFVLGVLTENGAEFLVDPSGMQSACCGIVDGEFYLSSHPQLIGDLCGLKMDPFVEHLIHYKWYGRVMGPYLPGDLTPFEKIKRIVPSIYYKLRDKTITHKRFWPLQAQEEGGCR